MDWIIILIAGRKYLAYQIEFYEKFNNFKVSNFFDTSDEQLQMAWNTEYNLSWLI